MASSAQSMPDNVEAIALLTSRHREPDGKAVDIIWSKSVGRLWGASPDLSLAVARMRNAVRGDMRVSAVSSTLLNVHGIVTILTGGLSVSSSTFNHQNVETVDLLHRTASDALHITVETRG